MASLSDIQTFLRQRRAAGKPITRQDYEAAYAGYFDAQNARRLQSSGLAIEKDRLAFQKETTARDQTRADQQLAFQKETTARNQTRADQQLAMNREQMDAAEDAAVMKGIVDIGMLGLKASETELGKKAISKVGSLFSSTPETATPAISTAAGTGAQGVVTGATGVPGVAVPYSAIEPGTGAVAEAAMGAGEGLMSSIGSGLTTAGLSIGAGLAADAVFGDKVKEAGDIASYATAGGMIGGPIGAVVGGVIGLAGDEIYETVKKVVDETFDFVEDAWDEGSDFLESTWDKASDVVGTWLCTKTRDTAGFSQAEWGALHTFRQYAKQNHGGWLSFYVNIGPALLKNMSSDPKFFMRMKKSFILPVIRLTLSGRLEAAYQVYKRVAIKLIERNAPHLLESAPSGGLEWQVS